MEMSVSQAKAVNITDTNVLVSASAGAGKTRVLVERLVKRCVKDHVGMDEILAVTFTEAAASEMKNRVAEALQNLFSNPESAEQAQWLEQQIVLLSTADITTIDSFCLNLIRKYYSVIGLDPATIRNVLDESSRKSLLHEAFHEALSFQKQANHGVLLDLLESISPRSEDFDGLQSMTLQLMETALQSVEPYAWIESVRSSYQQIHSFSDLQESVKDAFFSRLRMDYDTLCDMLDRMKALSEESEKLKKGFSQLEMSENLLLSCRNALVSCDYDQFREMFMIFGAEQKTPSDGKALAYTALRKEFYKKCDSLTSILYDSSVFIQDIEDLKRPVGLLCDLTADTLERFQNLKKEHAAMDFNDMEHYAWTILNKNNGEVASLFQSRFKEVMVDEFQDTSLLQDSIIRTLAKPGTIFRVGDVKQSIYRFRGAKPSLMRSLLRDPEIFNITLDKNYRSKEKIIQFSNTLFSRLMNVGGEDSYQDNDIVAAGTDRQKDDTSEPIKLILIEKDSDDVPALPSSPSETKETEARKEKRAKATWIANEMISLHQRGYRWKDFAVLVRSHQEKSILRSVFQYARIPSLIDTREGFFNSDLSQYILALLTCLIDSEDDISLITVLGGELFGFSDETLATLKLKHKSVHNGIHQEHPEVQELFEKLRKTARYSLTDLLSEIALYDGFYEKLSEDSKANFDFLFEKTAAMASSLTTIHDLILMMTIGSDEKSSAAVNRSKDDDLVTVTTIHQSKGLQYKVVFVWGTGSNPSMDSKNTLIIDDVIGAGLKHTDLPWHTTRPSLFRIAAEYRQSIADVEEYTRVLYVALTRAEETMYIVDLAKNEQDYCQVLTLGDLSRRKGITGLLTMALTPIPQLYDVYHVSSPSPLQAEEVIQTYSSTLPRYHGAPGDVGPILKPSEHELYSLPSLSPGNTSRNTAYGTTIHETIEALENRTWTKDDFTDSGLSEHAVKSLLTFSDSELYQKALTMDIHKEMPFYAEDPSTHERIMGVMDFVAFGDHEILLIDFKTDALSPEEIRSRYSSQIHLYQRALKLMEPDSHISAYAWSFHNNIAIEI